MTGSNTLKLQAIREQIFLEGVRGRGRVASLQSTANCRAASPPLVKVPQLMHPLVRGTQRPVKLHSVRTTPACGSNPKLFSSWEIEKPRAECFCHVSAVPPHLRTSSLFTSFVCPAKMFVSGQIKMLIWRMSHPQKNPTTNIINI